MFYLGPRREGLWGWDAVLGLSLSGFDHSVASSVRQHKNIAGQNRLSLLLSHYAHCLSPHQPPPPLFFRFSSRSPRTRSPSPFASPLPILFISPSITPFLLLLPLLSQPAQYKMHIAGARTHAHTHTVLLAVCLCFALPPSHTHRRTRLQF